MEDNQLRLLWREACAETPPAFSEKARLAIKNAHRKPQRRRIKRSLAIALGLTLLLGTAFALDRLGLLQSLRHRQRDNLLPQAQELVHTDIPQEAVQPELARFVVQEALYDGHQVYLTLRITPKDKDSVLLMGRESQAAFGYAKSNLDQDPYQGQSFAQKAQQENRTLVLSDLSGVMVNGKAAEEDVHAITYQQEEMLYTLSFQAGGEEAQVTLNLLAADVYQTPREADRGTLNFTLKKSGEIQTALMEGPLALPKSGLELTFCQVETTPLASYLLLRYTLLPQATPLQGVHFDDGIWANWLQSDGQAREPIDSQLSLEKQEDGGVALVQSFPALKELPREITLSFYNGMSKEVFDQISVSLHPKEEQ